MVKPIDNILYIKNAPFTSFSAFWTFFIFLCKNKLYDENIAPQPTLNLKAGFFQFQKKQFRSLSENT